MVSLEDMTISNGTDDNKAIVCRLVDKVMTAATTLTVVRSRPTHSAVQYTGMERRT